jgi:hypothetical protein
MRKQSVFKTPGVVAVQRPRVGHTCLLAISTTETALAPQHAATVVVAAQQGQAVPPPHVKG